MDVAFYFPACWVWDGWDGTEALMRMACASAAFDRRSSVISVDEERVKKSSL